jgi:hypothetical protein
LDSSLTNPRSRQLDSENGAAGKERVPFSNALQPDFGAFSEGRSIPQPVHPQRSTFNQSRHDPAARDTSGVHSVLQLIGESVNEFCLPPASGKPSRQAVFDLIGRNAGLELKGNARGCIHPELNDCEEVVGLSRSDGVRTMPKLRLRSAQP